MAASIGLESTNLGGTPAKLGADSEMRSIGARLMESCSETPDASSEEAPPRSRPGVTTRATS